MPIINRMKYVFQWNQIDEDFRIYKIVSTKNDKESAMQRRKAADMLINAGLPIRSAVYSGKKQNGAYGTYILVDRAESKDADIRNRFHELCGEMNVQLLTINRAISLSEDHKHGNMQDNDHGDENGLANLLLYGLVNEFDYSNVNGSLYYTTTPWVMKKDGEPRRFIKMIRLRFMANGILSANAETWASVDEKHKTDGPTYGMVSMDRFCRFKTMTPNMTEKTIVCYTQKGLRGHKADIPYLGFSKTSAFNESICGAVQHALQAVKENGKYMKLVPICYQNCETLPKGSGIARYSAYSKSKNNRYDQAWTDFLNGTSLCICAGAELSETEKEAVKPSIKKLAEALRMDGAASVEVNLDKAFADAAEENPDRYFIPVIHDKILQNEWQEIGKKLTDSGMHVDEALFKIIQPIYDDHYAIMKHDADIWEKVKYRTQHISLQSLTEEEDSKQIKAEARRIRCEFFIKSDIEKERLRVFDWEKMDEKNPVTCMQRDKIRIDAKRVWKETYDRNIYTVMTIFPDGRFKCRSFMETTDSDEEDRKIISEDQKYTEEDKQIVAAFQREEKKILSVYDYLQSKDIGQLYIYHETPEDGILIADSPVKMLPDLQKLSDRLQSYGKLTEKQRDDMVQEHLAAAWIAGHSTITPDQLRKRLEEKGKHLSLSMEDLFAISETKDIPKIKWHLAKKDAPTKYVPQKEDNEEKIKKEQDIINQMLEPYQFTYVSAMNVCDNIQYYRDHENEQDENDKMCLQLFGIRYLKNNRNSKTSALARLNIQCGDMLFTKWKSDVSYGIADMGKNFYRLASKETEPFLQDAGISMYYCGRYDIGNGSISAGRIWRYVVPADGKPLSKTEMEKLMQTMDTDLITSDNSRTVVPFMAKYMREYADNIVRKYRYETARSNYAYIPSKAQQEIFDLIQHSYLKQA